MRAIHYIPGSPFPAVVFSLFFILSILIIAAPSAALELEFEPRLIEAGKDQTIRITVKTGPAGSAPAPQPVLSAARGTFGPLEPLPTGDYKTTLDVPARQPPLPGFILLAASVIRDGEPQVATGAVTVFSNLRLSGRTAPGAVLFGMSGGRLLGRRFRAGDDGAYDIEIPVTPGISRIDLVVKKGRAEITNPIDIPAGDKLWFLAHPSRTVLEPGEKQAAVFVIAAGEDGRPAEAPGLGMACSPGDCSAVSLLSPGIYSTVYSPPDSFVSASAEIVAEIKGRTSRASIALKRPGLASLSLDAGSYAASPGSDVAFEIRALDTAGNAFANARIELYADGGFAGLAEEVEPGLYRFRYTVPDTSAGSISIKASAAARTGPEERIDSESINIEVRPADIELSVYDAPADVVPGQAETIILIARAENGGPPDELVITADAEAGEIDAPRIDDNKYSFTYTPPGEWDGGDIRIEFTTPARPDVDTLTLTMDWKPSETDAGETVADAAEPGGEEQGGDDGGEQAETETGGQQQEDAGGEPAPQPAALSVSISRETAYPGDTVTLSAEVVDEDGNGLEGYDVVFTAEKGAAGDPVAAGGGVVVASLTFPPDAAPGDVAVTAACDCGGQNLTDGTSMQLLPLPPASIQISSFQQEVDLGAADDITVTVTVSDKYGAPVDGVDVALTAKQDGGTQRETVTTGSNGSAETAVEVQWPEGEIIINAEAVEAGGVAGSLTITKRRYDISRIELIAPSQEIPADGSTRVEIEALAIDNGGNDAFGERIDFALDSGSGRLTDTDCETDEEGRCSVYYEAGTACGQAVIEAYVYRDDTVRTTVSVEETPAIPDKLSIAGTPAGLTANGRDTAALELLVRDAGGCPIENEKLEFSVSSGPGDVTADATTSAEGRAQAVFSAGLAPGTATVLAKTTSSPMLMLTTEIIVDTWTPSSFDVSVSQTSVSAGQELDVTVTALDSGGYTVTTYDPAGKVFAFSGFADSPGGDSPSYPSQAEMEAAFTSGPGGVARTAVTLFKAESAALTLTETAGNVTGSSQEVTVSDAGPYTISVTSGGQESIAIDADGASTAELDIALLDRYGNPVPGADVAVEVTQGDAAVSPATITTGAGGAASSQYTAGLACGENKVRVRPLSDVSVTDELTAAQAAAVPADLSFASASYSLPADNSSTVSLEVNAVDAGGCGVPDETIHFSVTAGAGAGTIGASAQTDSGGTAGAVYTAGGGSGSFTVNAVSDTAPAVSASVSVEQTAVTATQFRVEPAAYTQTAGVQFNVTVTAVDAGGSTVADYDPGGDTVQLLGASDAPDSTPPDVIGGAFTGGVAVLQVTLYKSETITPGVKYGALEGYAAAPLTVSSAAPAAISFTAGGAEEVSIDADAGATQLTLSASVTDSYGNPVPSETILFESDTPTDGGLSPASADTGASGDAGSVYTSGSACGDTTLTAYPQAYPAVSDSIIVHEAASIPDSITDTGGPYSVSADGASTVDITVRVDDAGGCPVDGETVNFSVTPAAGAGSVGASAGTGVSGVATATYTAGTGDGDYTVTATSDSVPAATRDITVTQTALPADYFTVVSPGGYTQTAGIPFDLVTTARNSLGNIVDDYDPGATPIDFTGAGPAPDATPPSIVEGTFTGGAATHTVTLFEATGTAALTVGYGAVEGTSANFTVDAGAPAGISKTGGDNQTAATSAEVAVSPTVKIVDDYGNPAPGAGVTFTVTAGGGSVTGGAQSTGADGTAAPDSWQLGPAPGANTLNADAGGGLSVDFSATAVSTQTVTAVINVESGSLKICPGGAIDFSAADSYPTSGYSITHWYWVFGNGDPLMDNVDPPPVTYNNPGTTNVTLQVFDDSVDSDTDVKAVTVSDAYLNTILQATPDRLDADGADIATIRSQEIVDCDGDPVADGTTYNLTTTLGAIVGGATVDSAGGVIEFQLMSGTTPGTAEITAESAGGLMSEDTVYIDIGVDTAMPYVTDFSPSGQLSSNFSEITIGFSEDVDLAASPDPSKFSVMDGATPVAGSWAYDDSDFTATFSPDTSPYSVAGKTITVTAGQDIADRASPPNYLDGELSGTAADFTFQFGGALADGTNPTVDCAPPGYGPDTSPFNPSEESTTIQFQITDETALSSWKLQIKQGGTVKRIYTGVAGPASPQTISRSWDGRDSEGNVVDDGVYQYRVYAVDSSYNFSEPCQDVVQVQNTIDFGTPFP